MRETPIRHMLYSHCQTMMIGSELWSILLQSLLNIVSRPNSLWTLVTKMLLRGTSSMIGPLSSISCQISLLWLVSLMLFQLIQSYKKFQKILRCFTIILSNGLTTQTLWQLSICLTIISIKQNTWQRSTLVTRHIPRMEIFTQQSSGPLTLGSLTIV